jgi:hydantoinase/carbamoylase family amidase
LPDLDRIAARLERLWQIAHGPGGGADRPAYSAAEAEAMMLVAGWAREAGLVPGIDRFGNLWALPEGSNGSVVTAGSHVDTVPDGGRYDGALGTVLGLELAESMAGAGLLVCAAEEAPRFGAGTVGSRLLVGTLPESELADLPDANGITAADALHGYLGALDSLPRVQPAIDRVRAHAEVHVAQRGALRTLGIVTRVASPRRSEIELVGESGHSGEVSMENRRDALAAAGEVVLAVERAARDEPPETVATVGTLTVSPGALSVIPGRTTLGLDSRGIDSGSLHRLDTRIRAAVDEIAERRGIRASVRLMRAGEPVTLDSGLVRAALDAAQRNGIAAAETWSGAGHDAQHLSALFPALLVFVPLEGGESHTPLEGADPTDIANATVVVGDVLAAVTERRHLIQSD